MTRRAAWSRLGRPVPSVRPSAARPNRFRIIASNRVVPDDECDSFQRALEFIGRRWVGAVLLAGSQGARRFGEYRRLVPGISDRLLSQRLKELERYHLMVREVVPTTPVQILYRPSPSGAELIEALQPLIAWSGHRRELVT